MEIDNYRCYHQRELYLNQVMAYNYV